MQCSVVWRLTTKTGLRINFVDILCSFPFAAHMRNRGETELPRPDTRYWTIRRKAAVLGALRSGALTID
jgi:Protein of unknown function (DUF1153)